MKDSIIRRGNHFIRIPKLGWTLIDGPWFEHLKHRAIGDGYWHPVFIPLYQSPRVVFYEIDDPPEYMKLEVVEWEAIRWHPGVNGPLARDRYYRTIYSDYLKRRARLGLRVVGGHTDDGKDWATGCLPAHLCCPYVLPWYEMDQLMERGM